jgi:hypothetical protein
MKMSSVTILTSAGLLLWGSGCAERAGTLGQGQPTEFVNVMGEPMPDTRQAISLPSEAVQEHRAVMLQHLETVQAIVAALAEDDFERAKGLSESHLGFFTRRQAIAKQRPADFPPPYHDLAMAHQEAAESLARVMPSRDMKQILPMFNQLLKACVACHLEFKVAGDRATKGRVLP